jgi:phosphoribosyl 1,2-cyclic phosphodiesterase
MTCGSRERRGVVVGNVHVIRGGEKYRPAFSPYHLKSVERYEILKAGDVTRIGKLEVTATPTSHGEEEGIGFVISGEARIGYTSDGEYFRGQEKYFEGCNILLVNCLRPRNDEWPKHMSSEQAAELISKVSPGIAVLKHFGRKMLNGVAEEEAAWIEKETGIRTIAARDGMVLEISSGGVEVSRPGKPEVKGNPGKFLG